MENFHFYFNEEDLLRAKVALFIWYRIIYNEYNCSSEMGYSKDYISVLIKNMENVQNTLVKFTKYIKELKEV